MVNEAKCHRATRFLMTLRDSKTPISLRPPIAMSLRISGYRLDSNECEFLIAMFISRILIFEIALPRTAWWGIFSRSEDLLESDKNAFNDPGSCWCASTSNVEPFLTSGSSKRAKLSSKNFWDVAMLYLLCCGAEKEKLKNSSP